VVKDGDVNREGRIGERGRREKMGCKREI